jgi:glutamine cyclotransferase
MSNNPLRHAILRRRLLGGAATASALALGPPTPPGFGLAEAATWPPQTGHTGLTRERVLGQDAIPVYGYRIAQTYPHDRMSYTEGLVMAGGSIYEGTGLYGQSKLLQWDLRTGRILHQVDLDPRYFGEGIAIMQGVIYQLTYLGDTCFTYDQKNFRSTGVIRYVTQGWGLTHDGKRLIMSDGSAAIVFRDPRSFEVAGRIFVSDNVGPVGFLNELEYANGRLYANVWQTDFIAIIAPESGKIIGWIDLSGLNPEPAILIFPFVLNGIAFNERSGRLLVTGKCWPHLYEIDLIPRKAS